MSILRGKGNVKEATISDAIHISFLDMNVATTAFVITKFNCILNFLSILWRLNKISKS